MSPSAQLASEQLKEIIEVATTILNEPFPHVVPTTFCVCALAVIRDGDLCIWAGLAN